MKVVGFHFKKMSIERLEGKNNNLKIRTEMDIHSIKEIEQSILKSQGELLEIGFEYNVNYEPEFAKIELHGTMLVSVDPKTSKEILKDWKKKELPDDIRVQIFNIILRKSTVRALELEDQLNLPPHMPLPSFKKDPEKNKTSL